VSRTAPARHGQTIEDYSAPLFLAWQLTNRCEARCLACCEESGPGQAWTDELQRQEALELTAQIIALGIPYVAFGGGEPLMVPHCWEIFERLAAAGVAIKLETNGSLIDRAAAARLTALGVGCVQISLDGASAATHQRVRPGSDFALALAAIDHLVAAGVPPQWVFVPTRLNLGEITECWRLASQHGCGAFVTGPLMRIGRAARDWQRLACSADDWRRAVDRLRREAAASDSRMALSIYPWDIEHELQERLNNPQAMLLVVPNGKVKLLNALPFAPADLRRRSLVDAWQDYRAAWRSSAVRAFIGRCGDDPALLRHANETWANETWANETGANETGAVAGSPSAAG
jgi:MoaA/NifB/PqqE/SkfB family radical SAM enzyme